MWPKKSARFDYYDLLGDLGNSETVGLLPCDKDYDYGTPNLKRAENVTYVASNSSLSECLLLRVKWRPNKDSQGSGVTLATRFSLILEGEAYEHSQVETYKPSGSPLRPGRILRYGSQASKTKIFIMSPYRSARILFQGPVRRADGGTAFLKFACVMQPISEIFDFYDQYNASCVKELHARAQLKRNLKQTLDELILHDRHEQKLRLSGEYLLIDGQNRHKKAVAMRGYHSRHFLGDGDKRSVKTLRFYSQMINGQGFQIGRRRLDGDEIDFGVTTFDIIPKASFIEKPYEMLDAAKLEPNLEKFELEISGQGCTFRAKAERKFQDWYRVDMNGKPGWGWMSRDDGLLEDESEASVMERVRSQLELDEKLARICKPAADLDSGARPLVVSIEEDCCTSSDLVGAKASSLAQLARFVKQNKDSGANYVVPHALVLTKFAHELILQENPKLAGAIEALGVFVGKHQLAAAREECEKVQQLVAECECPAAIMADLWQKLTAQYDDLGELSFAVRSSSWGEDEGDVSAAGQLTTVLNVKANQAEVRAAIMRCFASRFSYVNVAYKRNHGQPLDLPMAVVVQRMVACEKAGVMFTCEPRTGDESLLGIIANYGLGESVVSSKADPDSILVRVGLEPADVSLDGPPVAPGERKLSVEQVTVGKKNVIISSDHSAVARDQDTSRCCLEEAEILQLARCGLEVSHYFWSQRRDIEWGLWQGKLHLLQSRPVTFLEEFSEEELMHECDMPSAAEVIYLSRANVGEVMPYAVRPLTMHFSLRLWNLISLRLLAKFQPRDKIYLPYISLEIISEFYHTFFNCQASSLLALGDGKKSALTKSLEIGFFGREMGEQPEIVEAGRGFVKPPNPYSGAKFNLATLALRYAPLRTVELQRPTLERLRQDARKLKFAAGHESNKMLGLYNQLEQIARCGEQCFNNHIIISLFGSSANMMLSDLLSKYITDPQQLAAATNKFLAISPDVVSAQIPERIKRIAELIDAEGPGQAQKFASMPAEDALHVLAGDNRAAYCRAFAEFLDSFGHRCYNEFELAAHSWREDPKQVVQMIQKNCAALGSSDPEEAERRRQQQPARPSTIDQVIESLGLNLSLVDRLLIKYKLAPKSQLLLSMRERTKNLLVYNLDIMRESSRMLADEMQLSLRIPDRGLLYYLTMEELKPLVMDYQPAIVSQARMRRKLFEQKFSQLWKFDEVFHQIIPNHWKDKEALDEAISRAPKLFGTPASSGRVRAKVCLALGYTDLDKVRPGAILLTHSTDIAFSPVFPLISGIITEVGGLISHGAVVAREYGLPSVIGIPDVTRILQDGEEIVLDADNGAIIRLDLGAET